MSSKERIAKRKKQQQKSANRRLLFFRKQISAQTFRSVCCLFRRRPLAENKNQNTMSFKGNPKVQKVMVQPINLIFRYLQNRSRVQVWLYENISLRIEGHIVGFDEYMNLVLDDAEEYHVKTKNRRTLGRIMLKGDNITLIQNTNPTAAS